MPIVFRILADDQGSVIIDRVGKKAKALEMQFGKTSSMMMSMFGGMALHTAMGAAIGAIGNITKEMDTFQLNIRKIEQVGGITGKSLGQVTEQMKKLASTTSFTHSQISEAGVTLSRMGINTAETLGKILPNAMNLATVAGEDLNLTAEGLAQIFNIFNITSSESTSATNKIGVALNATAMDLKGFIESMQYAGGAAKASGVAFEDITAAIAYLSQTAISGSRAGTTMKNILISLVKPGSEAGKALKQSGLAANDLVGMFKLLSEKGVGIDKIVKMFGMWAAPGALNLQSGYKSFKQLRDEIISGNSDVAKQAEIINRENIPALQQLSGEITNLGMAIGEAVGLKKGNLWLALKDEISKMIGYVKENESNFRQLGETIKVLGSIVSRIADGGLKLMTEHFQSLLIAVGGLMAVGGLISLPPAILAISASAGGLATLATAIGVAFGTWSAPILAAVSALGLMIIAIERIDYLQNKRDNQQASQWKNLAESQGTQSYISVLEKLLSLRTDMEKDPKNRAKAKAYKDYEKDFVYAFGNQLNLVSDAGLRGEINKQRKLMLTSGPQISPELLAQRRKEDADKRERDRLAALISGSSGGSTAPKTGSKAELAAWWEDFYNRNPGEWMKKMGMGVNRTVPGTAGTRDMVGPGFSGFTIRTGITNPFDITSPLPNQVPFLANNMPGIVAPGAGPAENNSTYKKLSEFSLFNLKEETKDLKILRREKFDAAEAFINLAGTTADALLEIDTRRHEQIMANLEKENAALDDKYQRELAGAGDNAFKRAMIEQKYAKKKAELDRRAAEEKRNIQNSELARSKIEAGIQFSMTLLNLAASGAKAGIWGMLANIATGTAAAIPFLMAITQKSYRSGGEVDGIGNGTSDSVWARVSKGERILSVNELSKLGGNERIQSILDRNVAGNPRGSMNINIDRVYGSKTFVRELITTLKEELSR